MSNDNVMREFHTPNFTIRISAEEEQDLDLSFDESGRVQKQLEKGSLIAFVAHVEVIHRTTGAVLGEDYLGGCIYKSFADFMDHRACGKQNRKWAKQGKQGQCGSYFKEMISEVIGEARKELSELKTVKVRQS